MAKSSTRVCVNSIDVNLPHDVNDVLISEESKVKGDSKKQKKKQEAERQLRPHSTQGQWRWFRQRLHPNRRRLRRKDFEVYGFSIACLVCERIQNGLYGLIGYTKHTDLCRQRMEEAMTVQ